MKVNLNLKQKMQGFGMYANKGSAERIVNNGVQKTTNETQQRVQDVQDAYYNYKNKQLSLMVDTLMNGHITNSRKCPTLSEEINNDPRIDDEIKKLGDDKFVNLFIESEKRKTEKTYEQIIEDAEGLELSYDASEYDNFITAYKKFIIINPTKRKFAETVLDYHFYELMRLYSNALEKENSVLFVVGFSFADEHIATLTRRSAENNPTLKVIIFAYCDEEEKSLKKNIGIDSTCVNNNILIITPTKMRELNVDDDYNDIVCDIEHLDMNAINKIFEYINKTIHASYE